MMRRNSRHLRAWMSTLIVMGATLLAVIMANLAATNANTRFDLTFTGTHNLSPRTTQLLERLAPGYQIILAVDRTGVDQRCFDAVVDLVNQMADESSAIESRVIDVNSAAGRTQFDALIESLHAREKPLIDQQVSEFTTALQQWSAISNALRSAADDIAQLGQAVPNNRSDSQDIRSFMSQRSTLSNLLADQLDQVNAAVSSALTEDTRSTTDTATLRDRVVPELNKIVTQLTPVEAQLARFGVTDAMPESLRVPATTISRSINGSLDTLRITIDALVRFRRPSVFRIETALATGEACLVIGPTESELTGIDRESIIPSIATTAQPPAEAARQAEDMLTIALASVSAHDKPILVMLHAEVEPFVKTTPAFEQFIERNQLRGIDVVEWPLISSPQHPALEPIDPSGQRPVVYFAIAPNSAAASVRGDEALAGARRASTLGAALTKLIDEGANIALNINPSVFPTFGDVDPIAAAVRPFGITPLTGSPLVLSQLDGNGSRRTRTAADAVGPGGAQPLADALTGLSARILWPIVIDAPQTPGVETYPVLQIAGGTDRWLESQWIGLWQEAATNTTPVSAQFDPARDVRRDDYIVAQAAERANPRGTGRQRLLCIGSNAWALDRVAQERAQLDGRLVPLHPGNLELIDASVFWLAGQDDMIARGASTASSPTVAQLTPVQRTRMAWLILAGLPFGVLACGIGYRILRG